MDNKNKLIHRYNINIFNRYQDLVRSEKIESVKK